MAIYGIYALYDSIRMSTVRHGDASHPITLRHRIHLPIQCLGKVLKVLGISVLQEGIH